MLVRVAADAALVKIGGLAVEPLIGALRDQSEDVRKAVAEILCRIGDTRAVEPFIAALECRDRAVLSGIAAVAALG